MNIEKAYAKINLSLKVLGKLDNGFHELESIMVPVVDLYDELYFEESPDEQMILLDNEIENNSIIRAAEAFQKKYNTKGAKIRLIKRIPLEAGLAGGSADSSATLRGLNRLFNLNIPLKELEELAMTLGSDNVFCLYNRAAVCRGRGEKLEFINDEFTFSVLLIKPTFGLLTKDVFAKLNVIDNNRVQNDILLALRSNDPALLDENIYNDLLKPALILEPRLQSIISRFNDKNIRCHMSGSGTTLYLINHNNSVEQLNFNECEYAYVKHHLIKNAVCD